MVAWARRIRDAVAKRLVAKRLGLHLALLSVALTLPALWVGWQLDDHLQRLIVVGTAAGETGPAGVFRMLSGDPEANRAQIDRGFLPWWTADDIRLDFFRPLSAALTRLDYRMWPESPAPMHAHSLLWLGLLVVAATAAYRRLLGVTATAGLAAALYALDDALAVPATWLASRNGLLAACFGLLCVAAHDRWRRDGSHVAGWLAPLGLGLALSAGEAGLATCGYLFAYALLVDTGPRLRRWLTLLPAGVVVVAWAVFYRTSGYGTRGSAVYVDPATDPGGFLHAIVERLPFLVMGHWWPVPADVWLLSPASWWVAAALTGIVASAIGPLLARDPQSRFWCLGMLLALLPVCSGPPGNRLLAFVAFGAMGLLARFLAAVLGAGPSPVRSGALRPAFRLLALLWLTFHLLLAPIARPFVALSVRYLGERLTDGGSVIASDETLGDRDVVLVHAPEHLTFVAYPLIERLLADETLPRNVHVLTAGLGEVALARVDERTLRMSVPDGLFALGLGRLYRDPRRPETVGDRFVAGGVTYQIAEVDSRSGPTVIVARFPDALESPARRWLCWTGSGYESCEPPPVGRTLRISAATSLLHPHRTLELD